MKSDYLGQKLIVTGKHIKRALENGFTDYIKEKRIEEGITFINMELIHYLREHKSKDIFQKDLEIFLDLSPSTVSNIVRLMEKKGLITREPIAEDGRYKRICLTKKSLDIEDIVDELTSNIENNLSSQLTEDEKVIFLQLLNKINNSI